jgi:predicted metal-dependent phosphoesterase TrpH
MSLVDLHIHTTFSDGLYTPTQLCQQALQAGIKIIGFTDHDSLNGIEEGLQAAAKLGIKLIPGVELGSQQEGGSVHILGYGVRRDYEPLLEKMQWLRHAREARLEKILAKLKEHNIEVEVTECDPLNRAVGRPHVAKAMVAKGYVQGVQEAFDKYLGRGKSCYVPQPKLAPLEAVELIHAAGGLAVLAHPEEIHNRTLVADLYAHIPFDGIEVFHPSARESEVAGAFAYWQDFALERHLFITGGSDFHGYQDRYPVHLGDFEVQSDWVAAFLKLPLLQKYL